MKVTVDFETRSECNLKLAGAWKYAEHPSTDIFCMAYKIGSEPTKIWINPKYSASEGSGSLDEIISLVNGMRPDDYFEAHNAEFERAIWKHVFWPQYKVPVIPIKQWRCSAAKAAAHSLPRSLNEACKVLKLPAQKDMEGHKVMLRVSKPKAPSKKDPGIWDTTPSKLDILYKYCVKDVDSEYALSEKLPDLSVIEQRLWWVDQEINERGVYVDANSIESIIEMVEYTNEELLPEMRGLTNGLVSSPRQVQATIEWLHDNGVRIPNMQAGTVKKFLEMDIPLKARRVLEIRTILSKSSTSKYTKMLQMRGEGGRIRGTMMYHGASTGRWTGKGIQPQNMPRGTYPDSDYCLDLVINAEYGDIESFYDPVMIAASKLLRSVICAAPGKTLVCADYASIEMIVLAWLAGATDKVRLFDQGIDLYKNAAMGTFGVDYDDVTYTQRQIGKVQELALGYQGGWRAFLSMAKNYGLSVPDDITLCDLPKNSKDKEAMKAYRADWYDNGKKMTEGDARFRKWAAPLVTTWRNNNEEIKQLWWNYENAIMEAVKSGHSQEVGNVRFGVRDGILWIRLPSMRKLAYYNPQVESKLMPWKQTKTVNGKEVEEDVYKDVVSYMGFNSFVNRWQRQFGYGGKWVENVTQAVARDLLAYSILRLEEKGKKVVMHVHDEIIIESDTPCLEELISIMTLNPEWAGGLPIKAEGWAGKRYRK